MTGIPFPKGVGLVTRCPTRISMSKCSPSEPWQADVKLPTTVHGSEAFNKLGRNNNDDFKNRVSIIIHHMVYHHNFHHH